MRYTNDEKDEKYVIVINPSDKKVHTELINLHSQHAKYIFGTTEKTSYKISKGLDEITLPAVSAAIYKID